MADQSRIYYIDNLKILLATLVVIAHVLIGYTFEDTPYCVRDEERLLSSELQYFYYLCRVFLMEIFYYIAGFFLCKSLENHSISSILKNRIVRYGFPIFVFQVIFYFTPNAYVPGTWYLEILLIFTVIVLIIHQCSNKYLFKVRLSLAKILFCGLLISVLLSISRCLFGLGFRIILPFVHIEPGQVFKYAVFMYMGMLSYKNNWEEDLLGSSMTVYVVMVLSLILIVLGVYYRCEWLSKLAGVEYAFLDGFQGITICYSLLIIFKKHLNRTNKFFSLLSKQIMGIYLINSVYIFFVQYMVYDLNVSVASKAFIVFSGSMVFTVSTTSLMLKVPYLRNLL